MKIFGIGSDIVNIKRLEKFIKKKGTSFKKKVFSENEEQPFQDIKKLFYEGINSLVHKLLNIDE